MGVLVEAVLCQELVDDHASGWQSMETVVLIVFVAVAIVSHYLTSDCFILLLNVPLAPARPLAADA